MRGEIQRYRMAEIAALNSLSDIDVYRSAKALIDQHGEFEAELHATQRADELLEAGDVDGRRAWLRLLEAVREITSKEPSGRVH